MAARAFANKKVVISAVAVLLVTWMVLSVRGSSDYAYDRNKCSLMDKYAIEAGDRPPSSCTP